MQWRRNRKGFLLLFELAEPHRSEGAITAGAGGHLGTETLPCRVSWVCSAILWCFSPRCPLVTLQPATGVPINLSSLLSSPDGNHPTWFGAAHLGGPQCHNRTGWETFGFDYVGNADLGSNAQHLPTPQQSTATAVGIDAQIDTRCIWKKKVILLLCGSSYPNTWLRLKRNIKYHLVK